MVKRVQVGDRVVVAGTSQCGQCFQCLHGRPDYCQFTFFSNAHGTEAFPPFGEMRFPEETSRFILFYGRGSYA